MLKKTLEFIAKIYALFFARREFRLFNEYLFHLSLRGLGILNSQNDYLTGEKHWLKKYLKGKTKPVIIDVGANKGSYCAFVQESNLTSIIYAFEPHPKTFGILTKNTINTNIKLFNQAVGSREDSKELYDFESKDGSEQASLFQNVITDIYGGSAISHTVEVVQLDSVIFNENLDVVDLLKIDTEGNEYDVLLGCADSIKNKKIKAIHFEFNEMNIISNVRFKDFWDYLEHYDLFRILPGGNLLKIECYKIKTCEIYAFQNIVALLKLPN